MYKHTNQLTTGFTQKYNINKLVWYYEFDNPSEAITIEKKIKGWNRNKKIKLIKYKNPQFKDLLLNTGMLLPPSRVQHDIRSKTGQNH